MRGAAVNRAGQVVDDTRPIQYFVVSVLPSATSHGHEGTGECFVISGQGKLGSVEDVSASFMIDDKPLLVAATGPLTPRQADLNDIACVCHQVDKLARFSNSNRSLGRVFRRLYVRMPVRDPEHWGRFASQIEALLEFLTADTWTLEFVQRPRRQRQGEVLRAFPELGSQHGSVPDLVCLHSGGLDAFAGLLCFLERNPSVGSVLLVSLRTNESIGAVQDRIVDGLRDEIPSVRFSHVSVAARLAHGAGMHDRRGRGRSMRTRGFLFLALGSVAAMLAGASRLHVFENGVGALNLPCNAGQVAADTSRSVHPRTLQLVQQLVNTALEPQRLLEITNPHVFETKAQMCRVLSGHPARGLARDTVSCDALPQHQPGPKHCGVCTSCLYRRLSLLASGNGDVDSGTGYRYDMLVGKQFAFPYQQQRWRQLPFWPATRASGRPLRLSEHLLAGLGMRTGDIPARDYCPDLLPLHSMAQQAVTLRSCLSGASHGQRGCWSTLVRQFPTLDADVLEIAEGSGWEVEVLEERIMALYREHLSESEPFFRRAQEVEGAGEISRSGTTLAA
jgi:hypothetical protein